MSREKLQDDLSTRIMRLNDTEVMLLSLISETILTQVNVLDPCTDKEEILVSIVVDMTYHELVNRGVIKK